MELGFELIIIPIAPKFPKLPIFSKFPITHNASNDSNDPNVPTRSLNLRHEPTARYNGKLKAENGKLFFSTLTTRNK